MRRATLIIGFGAWVGAAALLLVGVSKGEAGTVNRRTPSVASVERPPDWSPYQIVVQRNIFDPSRLPPRTERGPTPTPVPPPETLDLTGVIVQASGPVALFEGSKIGSSKAVREGQEVEGLRMNQIRTEGVLASDGPTSLTLRVGVRLSRPVGASWRVGQRPAPISTPTPAPTASTLGRSRSSTGRSGSSTGRTTPTPSAAQASKDTPNSASGDQEGMSLIERLRERRRRELGQ